ncbi:MAG: ATP phosphoribosyltransferase regulatory subunit [Pseudomonadales bacterium]|nr:ATP phosphoribosyltransferase regulatory subunit [Pseudomonadales bacterium]
MSQNFQPLRGFRDLMGEDVARLAQVESVAIKVLQGYGYNEIRLPLLEVTSLFDRSIGESTDTVSKEMYTFELRDGSQVSLRPEATASCVRALLDSGAIRGSRPKWWYAGPMFRHEKPQRGRFRQFYQVGAEAFGYGDPDIDVEMICITADLLNALGELESAQ